MFDLLFSCFESYLRSYCRVWFSLKTFIVLFVFWFTVCIVPKESHAEIISMALEATSAAKGFFASEGDVEVENLVFNIDEDMNQKGAVTIYFVVCYDTTLLNALKSDTAEQFKKRSETYMHDYPDKIVILKWDVVAKKRVSAPIPVGKYYEKGGMSPVGGFIFVTYSSPGDHRYRIPGSWKGIEINLKKTECKLVQME